MGIKDVVFPLCSVLCALAFVYKAYDLRLKHRDPALIALLVAFASKAISFGLSTPAVSSAVDTHLNISNVAALGIHLSGGVVASAAILTALDYWLYPQRRARRRAAVQISLSVVLALIMITLWAVAAANTPQRWAHFLLENAHRPIIAAYLLLYVTAVGTGMVEIARMGWRFANVAGRSWLQRGLRMVTAGAILYVAYCVNRALAVVMVRIGADPLNWEFVTPLTNGLGILFLTAGLTIPSWGPMCSAGMATLRASVAHARLFPLWRDLYWVNPTIPLHPPTPGWANRLIISDAGYRLYRRVIEIKDGCLALRPYLSSAPADDGPHAVAPAAVEAKRIWSAIRAKAASASTAARKDVPLPLSHTSSSFAEELVWLRRVAAEYRRLPQPYGKLRRSGSPGPERQPLSQ